MFVVARIEGGKKKPLKTNERNKRCISALKK
jgi:hypothetical protein